jgi:hypothetical protein
MRIRVLQTPTVGAVDGIDLGRFFPGQQYEVGTSLGALFLAEGWAEPVSSPEPALAIPVSELGVDMPKAPTPSNLVRETFPPYYDAPPALALDRRRRPRHRRG